MDRTGSQNNHAKQHLYAAAEVAFPDHLDQAQTWVHQHADRLYAG